MVIWPASARLAVHRVLPFTKPGGLASPSFWRS